MDYSMESASMGLDYKENMNMKIAHTLNNRITKNKIAQFLNNSITKNSY